MSLMTLRCLVLNAGGPRWPAKGVGLAWLRDLLAGPDAPELAFVQEVPSREWLDCWTASGYDVALGPDRGWTVHSCLLSVRDVGVHPLDEAAHPELAYHGSYVAGGCCEAPTSVTSRC